MATKKTTKKRGTGMGQQSPVGRAAYTPTSTYDDGEFSRTAIVVDGGDTGSVDVVTKDGIRLAQINISFLPGKTAKGTLDAPVVQVDTFIVDVIDVDDRYPHRRALGFSNTERRAMDVPAGGKLVSVDFRGE